MIYTPNGEGINGKGCILAIDNKPIKIYWVFKSMGKTKIEKRIKRTNEELKEASKHLIWEIRYLSERHELFLRLGGKELKEENAGLLNSLNDSFLIHSRKLVEFFYSPNLTHPNDIIAEDYFDSPKSWKNIRPPKSETLSKAQKDFNKLLAHLTYASLNYPDGEHVWSISEIYVDIFNSLQIFIEAVDLTLLDDDISYLSIKNPEIIILCPVYPPEGKAPYQIRGVNQKASGFILEHDQDN